MRNNFVYKNKTIRRPPLLEINNSSIRGGNARLLFYSIQYRTSFLKNIKYDANLNCSFIKHITSYFSENHQFYLNHNR